MTGRKTRYISLHKNINQLSLLLISLVAILFLAANFTIIIFEFETLRIRQQNYFDRALESFNVAAEREEEYLTGFVVNDEIFTRIRAAGNKNSISVFNDITTVVNLFTQRTKSSRNVWGYFIGFGGESRYYTKESMSFAERQEIIRIIRESLKNGVVDEWQTAKVGSSVFAFYTAGYRGGTLTCIMNLTEEAISAGEHTQDKRIAFAFQNGEDKTAQIISETEENDGRVFLLNNRRYIFKETTFIPNVQMIMVGKILTADVFPVWFAFLIALEVISATLIGCWRRAEYKEIMEPLERLTSTMEDIRGGDLEKKLDTDKERVQEFASVGETLNTMMEEIMHLKIANYEESLQRQGAELQYLQLQLRPHFFLNCLKTINAMALTGNVDKCQDMISDISKHLRYLFRSNTEKLALSEELSFTRNYCDLRRKMTSAPFVYHEEIEKDIQECTVLPLCVQTFVENSIKYAIPNDDTLKVRVNIRRITDGENSFLDIVVADNGKGYPPEALEMLNRKEEAPVINRTGEHVGILNLKKRMRLVYGDSAEFMFNNHNGAVSEIMIPIGQVE